MVLDSLAPEVQRALSECCTVDAFDDDTFAALVEAHGLGDVEDELRDELITWAVVDEDRSKLLRRVRRERRRARQAWREAHAPRYN